MTTWRPRPGRRARPSSRTPAFGVFDGPLVAAANAAGLLRIRPRQLVLATGALEQPAVFPGSDLPGVMLSSAIDALVGRFGVLPGRNAVDADGETPGTRPPSSCGLVGRRSPS
ncbi:MAG: hypothetical protein U0V56_10535 [Actinomycetota bacterium]